MIPWLFRSGTKRVLFLILLLCSLQAVAAGFYSAHAGDEQPEIGDFIFCSPNWWFFRFSKFGHGAIYVGEHGGAGGNVVERTKNPDSIHFTTLNKLKQDYATVTWATVKAVSPQMRIDAAILAAAIARAIKNGEEVPEWYAKNYDFGPVDCISTFQKFYIDVGASLDQVGDPSKYALPGGAKWYYETERDWDQTITGNGGILSGGSQGGIESRPLWLGGSVGIGGSAAQSSGLLEQLMPDEALNGETGYPRTPDIIGSSNAVDAAGMDYIDGETGSTIASILGAETIDDVYEHDYAVCARVRRLEINDMFTVPTDTTWWWTMVSILPATDSSEVAFSFTIRLQGDSAVVDTRYPADIYGSVSGTVLNYQVRATNLVDAMYLVEGIIQAADEQFDVYYENTQMPAAATVFIRSACYEEPNVELLVDNSGTEHEVHFYGPVWTEPRSDAETFIDLLRTVQPGTSTVQLPVGLMYDAVIYAEDGAFLDKAYIPSGFWFSFDDNGDGGTSQVSMSLGELLHDRFSSADTTFVSPPMAEMTGYVTDVLPWGYIGIGYSPDRDRAPIDISDNYGIAFYVRGDGGQYRLKLEAAAVTDYDYHGAVFTAQPYWQLFCIPFSDLEQEGWGAPVPWTGTDLHTISFVTTDQPLASVYLVVDRISFVPEEITAVEHIRPKIRAVTIRNAPNPFFGTTRFDFALPAMTPTTLDIFDVSGRRIRSLIDRVVYRPGEYSIFWNGNDDNGRAVASGIYFYRLQTRMHRATGKVLLVR